MVSSSRLSPECREEMFSAMAESLQKHVVAAANFQIRSTKELLNLPDARGLLWVASDGNDFPQYVSWAQGIHVRTIAPTSNVEAIKFLGVREDLLQIDLSKEPD